MSVAARVLFLLILIVLLGGCRAPTASGARDAATVVPATVQPDRNVLLPSAARTAPVTLPGRAPSAPTSAAPSIARKIVVVTEQDGAGLEWFQKMAAGFRAVAGWQVDVVHKDREVLRIDFETAALAGQPPDLLWTASSMSGPLVAAQLIRPAGDLFNPADFATATTAAAQLDERQWGVPMTAGNHLVLFYNKKLLPAPPRTTDELLNLAHPAGADVILASNRSDPLWLAPWLGGFGGKLFADGGQPSLNSPEMIAALHLLKALHEKNILVTEPDFGASEAHFKIGKVAMIVDGSWAAQDYAAAVSGSRALDLGIASLPVISPTKRPATPFVSGSYLLAASSLSGERLDAAKAFIAYATGPTVQEHIASELRRLPALKAALRSSAVRGDPLLNPLADAMANATPLPVRPEMRGIWDGMQAPMAGVLTGEKEPEAAAQEMQSAAEEALKAGQ